MKLTKEQKKSQSKDLAEQLKKSPHVYFAAYQGLKFQELADLRSKLRLHKCRCRVVKNSLLENALKQAGIDGAQAELLKGPNAVVWAQQDDPVAPAKVLLQFAKEFPSLKVKAGYVGARWMASAECQRLSLLGGRPELLGKLAGALYSAVGQGAWVLAAPLRDLAWALKAVQEKKAAATAA